MSKTIVIFSTKGGVGKTLIASNISVGFGHFAKKKSVVLDLDLQAKGDMARFFNITPRKSLVDLAATLSNKSIEEIPIKDYITHIAAYGVDFLPIVLNPRQVPRIDTDKLKLILAYLEKNYDFMVIDAGRAFTETLIAALEYANLVLLVVQPDILSIYQTKWSLDVLQSLHIPLNMTKIILNRAQSLGGVSWQEVRAALPCEIISRVPSEGKVVGLALSRGVPVVIDSPYSKISRAVLGLQKELVEKEGLYLKRVSISPELLKQQEGLGLEEGGEVWQKLKFEEEPFFGESTAEQESDEIIELKKRIHQRLIEKMDLKHLEIDMSDPSKAKQIKERTERIVSTSLAEESGAYFSSLEIRKKLVKEIVDEALGLGPLEDLIQDSDISDIMVNNRNQIYIERKGKLELSPKRFITNDQVRQIIERIIAPLGRRIDESVPMVDARLADGSRVNAIIPPLALTGPTLTIRKFGRERLTIDDLMRLNSLSENMREFLRACVLSRKNMVISGGTGSGKTTLLNVLSTFVPVNERIITIEDAAELKLKQEHWVRLESRPPNIEGKGAITVRDLFRNSLRMRPDRIIIGECRGAESLDMLQAMNTGHDGSMTTIHANSTQDVLSRLDSMILMSGAELPVRAIREMIASAIDLVVQVARLSDGSRKITQITEITGMRDEMHIGLSDIFSFKQTGIDANGKALGFYTATGNIPTFIEELLVRGIKFSQDIFKPAT